MRILPINTYIKPYAPQQTRPAFKGNIHPNVDIIEFGTSPVYEKALTKLNKINKEEYDSLTYNEKEALRKNLIANEARLLNKDFLSEDLPMHHFAADSIKTVFDEQYGENNYVVITIGRSLSSISKLLEMKIGEENVKNIPLSHVDEFYAGDNFLRYSQAIDNFTGKYGFADFKKYLASIGLDKETIESSGKNYILMDYCHTGKSLDGAYTVLTSDQLLGNKKKNITTASIENVTFLTDPKLSRKLDHYLTTMKYKQYSFVDKFHGKMTNLDTVIDYHKFGNKINQETLKLFGFAMLDSQFSNHPYNSEVKLIRKYNNPNGSIWNSPDAQYNIDTNEDMQEVFKLMKRLERPIDQIDSEDDIYDTPEALYTKKALSTLATRIRRQYYGRNLCDGLGQSDYYSIFRPALLKYLEELNLKYPER